MNRQRMRAAVLLGVLVAGLLGVVAPSAVAASTTLPVLVQAARISPQVLQPGQDLSVTLTVTNNGSAAIAQPRVFLDLDRRSFVSRSSLDRWRLAGPYDSVGTAIGQVDLPGPLEVGASASVVVTAPAAAIGLPSAATSWGARGLAVEVVDAADPTRLRLGLLRTFTVWFPPQEVTPTTLSVLVPITGPAPTADEATERAALTAPGGRLDQVLQATSSHPGVTWAVDPALLTSAESDRTGSGAGWAAELLRSTTGREVQLLPWGDADLSALAHTGDSTVTQLAEARSAQAAEDLGLSTDDVFAVPGAPVTDLTTAMAASAGGARSVVVSPGELLAPTVLTYTPSGVTTTTSGTTDLTLLVPDEALTRDLTTGTFAQDPSPDDTAQRTGASAAADLLAELAIITRERPSDGRHVLASLPRDWAPDAVIASAQLAALTAAPWVRLAPVSELAASTPPSVDRGTLPVRVVDEAEVSAAELVTVRRTVEERLAIAAMGADPAALVGDADAERLRPAALAWRKDTAGRTTSIASSVATTAQLRAAVSVPPTGTVNLISTSGDLPLRVDNALDQAVTLMVRLRPTDSRLVADTPVQVVVPARGETTVRIPVHGVQSADVRVVVELSTEEGTVVDASTQLTVRVRAEWENIGTGVIGGVLALGLVIGLVRTARRARGTRADRAAAAGQPGALLDEAEDES